MRRIRFRLSVLFVVVVTLMLTLFGVQSHLTLGNELAQRSAQMQRGVLARLSASLPTPMRSLESGALTDILMAELLPPEVQAIRLYDSVGALFMGRMRSPDGTVLPIPPGAAAAPGALRIDLEFRGVEGKLVPVGRAQVSFSDARIGAALGAQWQRKAVEIVLLDLILVIALTLSLRLVFVPLSKLSARLSDLAEQESEHVDELPEDQSREFGELARAFNRIVRKLESIITRARIAEAEALNSGRLTGEAYQHLQRAQDSLVQAERMAGLGTLVAGVAHEVNTPVGITLTSASVLQEATVNIKIAMAVGSIKKSDMLSYLDTAAESTHLIMVNAERAAHLIQSFKQIAVDQTSEERRRFVLREYLDEIVLSLRPRLRNTRVGVVIDCPKFLSVDGYPGAFAQIITNLTLNALVHAFEPNTDGRIMIDISQDGELIELRFSDNGQGIAPHLLDKIFDPFFTTRRGQGGTGLGLNIVYNLIVRTFGGVVTVASRVGEGTCFTIRMPQVAPKEPV